MSLISEIRTDMEAQLTDNRLNQMINYPEVRFICSFNVNILFL
jgi:hypothetical protein